jgi:hypothetical protein
LRTIRESVLAATRKQMNSELPLIADRHFKALGRILDREEPEYRF